MDLLDDLFRRIAELLKRLLGHSKRSPREILQRHGRQVQPPRQPTIEPPYQPPRQPTIEPPIEPPVKPEKIFVIDIDDDAALDAVARAHAKAGELQLAVGQHFAHQRHDFGAADVQCDDEVLVFLFGIEIVGYYTLQRLKCLLFL